MLCRRRNRFHTGFLGKVLDGLEDGVEGDVDADDVGVGLGFDFGGGLGLLEKKPDVRTGYTRKCPIISIGGGAGAGTRRLTVETEGDDACPRKFEAGDDVEVDVDEEDGGMMLLLSNISNETGKPNDPAAIYDDARSLKRMGEGGREDGSGQSLGISMLASDA